jgi:hypothetical protein
MAATCAASIKIVRRNASVLAGRTTSSTICGALPAMMSRAGTVITSQNHGRRRAPDQKAERATETATITMKNRNMGIASRGNAGSPAGRATAIMK